MKLLLITTVLFFCNVALTQEEGGLAERRFQEPTCIDGVIKYPEIKDFVVDFCVNGKGINNLNECISWMEANTKEQLQDEFTTFLLKKGQKICGERIESK